MWFFGLAWSHRIEAGVIALWLGYRVGVSRAWMNQPISLCRGKGKALVVGWVGGSIRKMHFIPGMP